MIPLVLAGIVVVIVAQAVLIWALSRDSSHHDLRIISLEMSRDNQAEEMESLECRLRKSLREVSG